MPYITELYVCVMQGFVAFCWTNIQLSVHSVGTQKTCSGTLCGGLYGADKCPCVRTSELGRHAVSVIMSVREKDDDGVEYDLCARLGIRLQAYTSLQLTDSLVDRDKLQVRLVNY